MGLPSRSFGAGRTRAEPPVLGWAGWVIPEPCPELPSPIPAGFARALLRSVHRCELLTAEGLTQPRRLRALFTPPSKLRVPLQPGRVPGCVTAHGGCPKWGRAQHRSSAPRQLCLCPGMRGGRVRRGDASPRWAGMSWAAAEGDSVVGALLLGGEKG